MTEGVVHTEDGNNDGLSGRDGSCAGDYISGSVDMPAADTRCSNRTKIVVASLAIISLRCDSCKFWRRYLPDITFHSSKFKKRGGVLPGMFCSLPNSWWIVLHLHLGSRSSISHSSSISRPNGKSY